MRALIIEKDAALTDHLEAALSAHHHAGYAVHTGEEGVDLAKRYDYDVVLTEIELPDMKSGSIISRIRETGVKTPIIVLSGQAEIQCKVSALNRGADDYVTKPFHLDELLARMGAVTRRIHGQVEAVVRLGALELKLHERQVYVNHVHVGLSQMEYSLLELLAQPVGRLRSRHNILVKLYNAQDGPLSNTIEVFVGKLRKKLTKAGLGPNAITTVRYRGYMLDSRALSL